MRKVIEAMLPHERRYTPIRESKETVTASDRKVISAIDESTDWWGNPMLYLNFDVENSDYYDTIRNVDIREAYRKQNFDYLEKELLITSAFLSIQIKHSLLKKLHKECRDLRRKLDIHDMIKLYKAVEQQILHPNGNILYICMSERIESEFSSDRLNSYLDTTTPNIECFSTFEDYVKSLNRYSIYSRVTLPDKIIQVGKNEAGTYKELLAFNVDVLDGGYMIRDFSWLDDDLFMNYYGIRSETIERKFDWLDKRYMLPYEDGTKLKLKTPYMTHSCHGYLDSEIDGNGTYYAFFTRSKSNPDEENKDLLVLSSILLNYYNDLQLRTADWIMDW